MAGRVVGVENAALRPAEFREVGHGAAAGGFVGVARSGVALWPAEVERGAAAGGVPAERRSGPQEPSLTMRLSPSLTAAGQAPKV